MKILFSYVKIPLLAGDRLALLHCPHIHTLLPPQVWNKDNGSLLKLSGEEVSSDGVLVYCSTLFPRGDKLLVISPNLDGDGAGMNYCGFKKQQHMSPPL